MGGSAGVDNPVRGRWWWRVELQRRERIGQSVRSPWQHRALGLGWCELLLLRRCHVGVAELLLLLDLQGHTVEGRQAVLWLKSRWRERRLRQKEGQRRCKEPGGRLLWTRGTGAWSSGARTSRP